jgi:hypothetical protein
VAAQIGRERIRKPRNLIAIARDTLKGDLPRPRRPGWSVLACFAAGLLLAGTQSVAAVPDSDADREATLLLRKPLVENHLRVRWEATVHASGGRFQVWKGKALSSLGLVADVEAANGPFEFVDRQPAIGPTIYQLRFKDRDGGERVLATRVVNVEVMTSHGSIVPPQGPTIAPALVTDTVAAAPTESTAPAVGSTPLAAQHVRVPPTPPPRAARPVAIES